MVDVAESTLGGHRFEESPAMGLAIALVLLALLLGGVGLAVEALRWVVIVAIVLFVLSLITGFRGRRVA